VGHTQGKRNSTDTTDSMAWRFANRHAEREPRHSRPRAAHRLTEPVLLELPVAYLGAPADGKRAGRAE
jgi:hypothetical protein